MKLGIIGVPQDIGSAKRGVDMGPSAMRVAGLHEAIMKHGYDILDFGNISCFDIDSIDPFEAPGTGYNIPGGLSYREARLIMEMIYDCEMLSSMDVVELNPAQDIRNKTGAVAVELISCALGRQLHL